MLCPKHLSLTHKGLLSFICIVAVGYMFPIYERLSLTLGLYAYGIHSSAR